MVDHLKRIDALQRTNAILHDFLLDRLADPDTPLHGFYQFADGDHAAYFVPREGETWQAYQQDFLFMPWLPLLFSFSNSQPEGTLDDIFINGIYGTEDTFILLPRSIQLIDEAQERLRKIDHPGTWHCNELFDIKIAFDSALLYLRAILDYLSMTFPVIIDPTMRELRKKRESYRNLIKWAENQNVPARRDSRIGRLILHDLSWFYLIAGEGKGDDEAGLRNYRIHYGSRLGVIPPGFQVMADIFGTPAGTVFEYCRAWLAGPRLKGPVDLDHIHSQDLVKDMQTVLFGELSFLDRLVRDVIQNDPKLLQRSRMTSGLISVQGQSFEFLKTFMPVLNGPVLPLYPEDGSDVFSALL